MRKVFWLASLLVLAPSLSTGAEPVPAKTPPVCGADNPGVTADAVKLTLLPGFGSEQWAVKTISKPAQDWFDYGVRLSHAFNHQEGIEAFTKAEMADPACAMCVWGEAWSRGPTINFPIDQKQRVANLALVKKAAVLAEGGPEKERLLIAAMGRRYEGDNRGNAADFAFAKAMDALTVRYPDDDEIAIIAADAWLNTTWNNDGKAASARSIALLERVLARSPDNVAAIHFYIHATEFAGQPGKAEPYADKLGRLAPAAGHLVHMPSHTWFAIGRYRDAGLANLQAVEADHGFLTAQGRKDDPWRMTYHSHNARFGMAGALMSDDTVTGLKLAEHHLSVLPELKAADSWLQFAAAGGYVVYGRLGDPAAMLAIKDPTIGQPMARMLWRYGRGEAYARLGDAAKVRAEAEAMWSERRSVRQGDGPAVSEIARLVLLGRAAMLDGKPAQAATFYARAARIQEAKFTGYGDPPTWWFPVRRSVAAARLQAGQDDLAVREANASLAKWPHDPLALLVLSQAERRLGRTAEADKHLAEARMGWVGRLDGFALGQV